MFEVRTKAESARIPNVLDAGPHVFFGGYLAADISAIPLSVTYTCYPNIGDVFGNKDSKAPNPIVGSWFRIEQGPSATPPPYTYDEVGIIVEGMCCNQAGA